MLKVGYVQNENCMVHLSYYPVPFTKEVPIAKLLFLSAFENDNFAVKQVEAYLLLLKEIAKTT